MRKLSPPQQAFLSHTRYGLLLCLLLTLNSCLSSDTSFRQRFLIQGSTFEAIKDRTNAHYPHYGVTDWEAYLAAVKADEALQDLKYLAGVESVYIRSLATYETPDNPRAILLMHISTTDRLLGWPSYKGIAYVPEPFPKRYKRFIVTNTNNIDDSLRQSETDIFFVPIQGNWYVYREDKD